MAGHKAPEGNIPAEEALRRLKEGNDIFVRSAEYNGDITAERLLDAADHGQHPYAAIVSCSDSRVIPDVIFSAGIGELFVIRTAGNIVDDINTYGSLEYAVDHLGCKLIVVLGHNEGHSLQIIKVITDAIGDEKDPDKASRLNVENSVREISEGKEGREGLMVIGAMYDIDHGNVEFFE